MSKIEKLLVQFEEIAADPASRLEACQAQGKKVIGCLPLYCPEELVAAAGMIPFGLWGAEIEVSKSKEYFPAFICSILQTTLEMGLRGDLDSLSAVMIPVLCDSLKCMGQNWKQGVKNVEFIPVIHPQNRKIEAGVEFLITQYRKIIQRLEEISGREITADRLQESILLYNNYRKTMREFVDTAASYPELLTPTRRNAVIKSGYFMDKSEHIKLVQELTAVLKQQPVKEWEGLKVVTSGIIADSPHILRILEQHKMAVAADDIAHESRQFRVDVPQADDPVEALARQFSLREGCSLLFDPEKKRLEMIVEQVRKYSADGVIVLMTKFCEPEEYDYPLLKKALDREGIPSIMIEVDQQMRNYEQARTMVQTFADMLSN